MEGGAGLQVEESARRDGFDLFRIEFLNIKALDNALVIGSRDWILRITNPIPDFSKQISRIAGWQKGKGLVVVSIPDRICAARVLCFTNLQSFDYTSTTGYIYLYRVIFCKTVSREVHRIEFVGEFDG